MPPTMSRLHDIYVLPRWSRSALLFGHWLRLSRGLLVSDRERSTDREGSTARDDPGYPPEACFIANPCSLAKLFRGSKARGKPEMRFIPVEDVAGSECVSKQSGSNGRVMLDPATLAFSNRPPSFLTKLGSLTRPATPCL